MAKKNQQPKNVVTLVSVTPEEQQNLLAKAGQFKVEDVPALVANLEKAISDLEGDKNEGNEVTEELDGFGKIQDIDDVNDLIQARAFVVNSALRYNEQKAELQKLATMAKLPEFKVAGGTLEQALNTIDNTFKKKVNKDLIKKFKTMRENLKEYLTKEQKLNAEMQDIADLFAQVTK